LTGVAADPKPPNTEVLVEEVDEGFPNPNPPVVAALLPNGVEGAVPKPIAVVAAPALEGAGVLKPPLPNTDDPNDGCCCGCDGCSAAG